MPLLLKVCLGIFDNSSRDQRELEAAREAGFDVKVLASPRKNQAGGVVEDVKGFEVYRVGFAKQLEKTAEEAAVPPTEKDKKDAIEKRAKALAAKEARAARAAERRKYKFNMPYIFIVTYVCSLVYCYSRRLYYRIILPGIRRIYKFFFLIIRNLSRFIIKKLGRIKFLSKRLNRVSKKLPLPLYYKWLRDIEIISPDVLSGHDIQALWICWLYARKIPKDKRPLLVYDSHEFELGRNTAVPRTKKQLRKLAKQEKFLMERCAFSIMVNDSIADEVQRIHHLKERPLVVRSTPDCWELNEDLITLRRNEMLSQLGADQNAFVAMYHGGITFNRGIELFISALQQNPQIYGVVLGFPIREEYLDTLKALAEEKKITQRIIFLPAVPLNTLWQYVGAADVGLVSFQNTCQSYYFSLPNKFFENVQSLTPVICSDLPELRSLVNHYDIGLLYESQSAEEMGTRLEQLRCDNELYNRFKQNLQIAKKDLCWQNEQHKLIDAYATLLPQIAKKSAV